VHRPDIDLELKSYLLRELIERKLDIGLNLIEDFALYSMGLLVFNDFEGLYEIE
jgi:hypothetical protein